MGRVRAFAAPPFERKALWRVGGIPNLERPYKSLVRAKWIGWFYRREIIILKVAKRPGGRGTLLGDKKGRQGMNLEDDRRLTR